MGGREQQGREQPREGHAQPTREGSTSTRMSHASVSQLMLQLPNIPTYQRLYVTAAGVPALEGKFMRPADTAQEATWVNIDKGSGEDVGRIYHTGERWCVKVPGAAALSEKCPASTWPDQAGTWQLANSKPNEPERPVVVSATPGDRFIWETDITAIGRPKEFEVAILAGIQELEEHIYIAHKAAYIDNVGSMYRLPRNPQAETGGAPEDYRLFDIKDFLHYLYSPEGLGWLDGRPAVLAALIYMDRIRARGRIVSRRSVHRLLVSAVLIGHEYFTQVMKEAGVTNVEPAPLNEMCQMTFLPPDSIEPLITRFKGMMDFEQAVLEQDVTSYCGALQGGVQLSQELIDDAAKVRVPGQQGLSSQQDGMQRIRRWAEEVAASRSTPTSGDAERKTAHAARVATPQRQTTPAAATPNVTSQEPATPAPTPGPAASPELATPTPTPARGQASPGSVSPQRSPPPGSPQPESGTSPAGGDLGRLSMPQLLEIAKNLNIDTPPGMEKNEIIERITMCCWLGKEGNGVGGVVTPAQPIEVDGN